MSMSPSAYTSRSKAIVRLTLLLLIAATAQSALAQTAGAQKMDRPASHRMAQAVGTSRIIVQGIDAESLPLVDSLVEQKGGKKLRALPIMRLEVPPDTK